MRDQRRVVVAAVLIVSGLLGGALAAAVQNLADVGHDSITREEFLATVATMRRAGDLGLTLKTMTREGHAEILEDMIEKRLLASAARLEGLQTVPAVRDAIERATREILGQAYLERKLAEPDLTDEELRRYYDTHREEFVVRQRVKARHIVVRTRAEAEDVLAQLRKGADFATLARERTIEPATRGTGGDLGWIPRGVMTAAFEQAVFAVKPGELSAAIETPFGFHVVRVDELQEQAVPAFETVREGVRERVVANRRQTLRKALADRIGVTVNQAALEALTPK
jgi:peptidyl-prolyl cis-trans isomerase C